MSTSRGKEFEKRVKLDWEKSVKDSFIYRLFDTTFGYKNIGNISDYIAYKYPNMFCIESKCHEGGTFPFSAFPQFEKMIEYQNITGLHLGVVLWMVDHNKVMWIPLETFKKIKSENGKSFNIKMLGNSKYEVLDLNASFPRLFPVIDFNNLINYYKEK